MGELVEPPLDLPGRATHPVRAMIYTIEREH
jgi:hypothetical protein